MYLLNARALMQMAESVEGDAKTRARIRFAVQQWIDAIGPSNFLALNPEALQKALETKGQSLAAGMQQLLADAQGPCLADRRERASRSAATWPPPKARWCSRTSCSSSSNTSRSTAKVHERPMLFVPPCINKYYILDLQPENSLIRYTVEQGHRTFVVSWRNPDESLVGKTWDDYIEHGRHRAPSHVVQEITGAETINTLGFCVGGTILATALAVLAARGEQPAHSVTLLTTLLDFATPACSTSSSTKPRCSCAR